MSLDNLMLVFDTVENCSCKGECKGLQLYMQIIHKMVPLIPLYQKLQMFIFEIIAFILLMIKHMQCVSVDHISNSLFR